MRPIDADELKKKLEAEHCDCEIMAMIDNMPTVAETVNIKAAAIMQHYGAEHQKDILIEECAELIQATEKTRRFGETTELTSDMVEEMADVQIVLWQFMSLMSGYWEGVFGRMVSGKLRRQIDRIEKEVEDST